MQGLKGLCYKLVAVRLSPSRSLDCEPCSIYWRPAVARDWPERDGVEKNEALIPLTGRCGISPKWSASPREARTLWVL